MGNNSTQFLRQFQKFLSKISPDGWILLLVSMASFLRWIKFPLSGGISPFSLYSPVFLSWGLLFLLIVILAIIGVSRWFLFVLLVVVFSFPLQIHWNYIFVEDISSEVVQMNNIRQFARENIYEPNIINNTPTDISPSDINNLWSNPWARVVLTVKSLGAGFWVAFIGTIIVSRKLGAKKIIFALLVSFALSLPGIITASFMVLGRSAFLVGDYSRSVDMYRIAMRINQSFGNKTLNKLGLYYEWVGQSLFHMGIEDIPEIYFFLGRNLERVNSFMKSKEMYRESANLPPGKKALARVMVEEAVSDFQKENFGSAMERLKEAYVLDRNQVEALFYMTYISFLLKDQGSALYYSSLLFDKCKEKLLFSDLYNIIGDVYQRTDNLADSNAIYRKSINVFDLIKRGNYHAWKGRAGW